MPKRLLGPFLALQSLANIDVDSADILDILERQDFINGVLGDAGCCCNGHALGNQRDEYWGSDLSELVIRCSPHVITGTNEIGAPTTKRVRIKIDTLRVEIDANNEVCAWIYEES